VLQICKNILVHIEPKLKRERASRSLTTIMMRSKGKQRKAILT
jgi:hypothetical protein